MDSNSDVDVLIETVIPEIATDYLPGEVANKALNKDISASVQSSFNDVKKQREEILPLPRIAVNFLFFVFYILQYSAMVY